MKLELMSLQQLTAAYTDAHRALGERSLANAQCETAIMKVLQEMAQDAPRIALEHDFQEQRHFLYMHKDAAYRLILSIYQIEAEMDRRGV